MKVNLRLGALLALGFTVGAANAQTSSKLSINPNVKTGKLANGLRYYILQNKQPQSKIELRLVVNAGSILENAEQQGLAHFMEHMNFNGLKHFPHNDLVHYLQGAGVKFGADLNAYTSFEETVYMLPIPSTDKTVIDKGFTVIADWSHDALLTNDEIDKERGVVLEESRLGKGADDRMMKQYLPAMLNGSVYAARLPIGKDDVLKNFKYDVLKKYHADWYRPDNEAVIVVGDIDPAEAERLIKEKFSAFKNPAGEKARGGITALPARAESKAMVVTDKEATYTTVQIYGNYKRADQATTSEGYREDMIKNLFNSMLGQRLDDLKSSPKPPFIFASAGVNGGWVRGYESFSAFAVCGTKQAKDATDALVTESMRVKKYGFTAEELERAKASLLSSYESSYNERDKTQSANLVGELIRNFLTNEPIPGITWEYNFAKATAPGITLKEVNDEAKQIDIDNKFFALITAKDDPSLPKDGELFSWVNADVKAPVAAFEEKKIASTLLAAAPTAGTITKEESNAKLGTTTYTLSNGASVTIRPSDFKNDELVLNSIRFGGASVYPGADHQSADFSNNVVDEMGYGSFSKNDLEKYLQGKKVNVSTVVTDYTEYITASSGVKDAESMFQLIYLKCTAPGNDADAFQSYVSREKQQLEQMMQSPQFSFSENSYNDLYQKNPRAHVSPLPEDFDKIDPAHAVAFYKERLGNMNGMHFFIAGNIKPEEIKVLIEKYIASIPGGPINTTYRDLNLVPKPGVNTFTYNKGKDKKSILMHYIFGTEKYNPDEAFLINVLNEVINNKITDTIREAMSAIYGGGIGGTLQKIPSGQYLMRSYLPCGPENVTKVDNAFKAIIASVKAAGGITESDLNKARKPLIEANKTRLRTNQYWIGVLQDADKNGYTPERILTYEDRLNAVTPQRLTEIANKFYSLKNIYTAILLPE